jgi:ABC-type multidrug transport system ATPase subunit
MKLAIKNLSKKYGSRCALDNVSVEFEEGIYGVLGANGAGKSTLISILTNNLKAESGEITLDGRNIFEMGNDYRKLIGYMPQELVVYNQFTAREFLSYMATLKGLNPKSKGIKDEISELLEVVNLSHFENERIGGFSGGMKRRVLFAQALLGNPQIIILDEPTAGLDPKERIAMRNTIVTRSAGRIILVATHIASDIESIASSVVIMKSGSVIQNSKLDKLYDDVKPYVNILKCDLREVGKYISEKNVYNLIPKGNELEVHFVCKDKKQEMDVSENQGGQICLDDVFLYYCQ